MKVNMLKLKLDLEMVCEFNNNKSYIQLNSLISRPPLLCSVQYTKVEDTVKNRKGLVSLIT